MVIGEWIALGGLLLGGFTAFVAAGKTLLENSVETSKKLTHIASSVDSTCDDLVEIKDSMKELRSEQKIKLTHIASSVDSTCDDLVEIKDSMKELRSEQKIHAARVEAMERQAREDRYLDQQRHDELRGKVKDLWKIFKESHPELFKRQSDLTEDE